MFRNICIILNPVSGGRNKKRILDYVESFCQQYFSDCSQTATTGRGDATKIALKAVAEKKDLVVVIGGDGTINEVASGILGSSVPIAIIPTGSGNGLARSLGIPKNIKKACDLLVQGKKKAIDVGKVNDRYFFLVAGVGFDAVVGKKFDELQRRGALSYFYAGALEFRNYEPEALQVSFDEHTFKISPFVFAVANGRQYGNNAIIAPDAQLDDGLLDICIIPPMTYASFFNTLPKLFTGTITKMKGAKFYQSKSVEIRREEPGYINIDGEPVSEAAVLKIAILPKSLNIISPVNSPALTR